MTITRMVQNNIQFFQKRSLLRPIVVCACLLPFSALAQNSAYSLRTVVIDAGHGGKDPGAVGKNVKEKDLTLAMALKTGQLINTAYPDVNVIYTRKTDEFVELYKRAEIANRANADLFISIHVNASTNIAAVGTDTWIMGLSKSNANLEVAKRENKSIDKENANSGQYKGLSVDDTESIILFTLMQSANLEHSGNLAALCQTEFRENVGRKDRGVHTAPFLVLWQTTMPSVLVETGFISNEEEEAYLMTEEGKNTISAAIFRAFSNYKNYIENKSNVKVAQQATSTMRPQEIKPEEQKKETPATPTPSQDISSQINAPRTTSTAQVQANEVFRPHEVTAQTQNTAQSTQNQTTTQVQTPTQSTAKPATPTTPAQPQTPAKPAAQPIATPAPTNAANNSVYYSVQIAASRAQMPLNSEKFKGETVYEISDDGWYKYNVAKTATYGEITKIQQQIKAKFPESFIVARKGNEKISLSEARQIAP